MTCSQCVGAGRFFDERIARSELGRYRRKGPRATTRRLVSELVHDGMPAGASLLDIGGGIGAIQHELLGAGLSRAISVDAAPAYIRVAREAASDRGVTERIEFIEADFVDVADNVDPVDYVSLDRVVCCYPDARALVTLAASKALRRMVLVAPRDGFVMRSLLRFPNAYMWLRRNPFRVYAHSLASIEAWAGVSELRLVERFNRGLWTVLTFERARP